MAVLPKVRPALCAASQLPREGPTDVEDALTSAHYSKPDDDDKLTWDQSMSVVRQQQFALYNSIQLGQFLSGNSTGTYRNVL